jgi:dihydroflavonol-4-reductase
MRCLVTGGSGFLGRHLVRQLVQEGHEVRALVRREVPGLEKDGARCVPGDVLEPETLAEASRGVEAVFHLAGMVRHRGEPTELYRLHVEGTRNTLRAAAEAGVGRVVHVSSSGTLAVTEDGATIPDETAPWATAVVRRWPYYLSKIYAEKLALEAHLRGKLPVVVVSPSLLLGPGDETLSSSRVVLRHLRREVPAVPPGGINFVDVRDVAVTTVAAAEKGRPGERYLLGGPNMTLAAFFQLLERVSGVPAPALKTPARLNEAAARVLGALEELSGEDVDEAIAYEMGNCFWYLDARKAQEELGFRHRPAETTLKDTVASIRSRGPMNRAQGLLGAAVRHVRRALDPR